MLQLTPSSSLSSNSSATPSSTTTTTNYSEKGTSPPRVNYSTKPIMSTADRINKSLAVPIRRARAISNPPPLAPAPSINDPDYDPQLARMATKILYRSGHDASGNPLLILSAASFPDAREVDYLGLLPYVLALLPGEQEMAHLDAHGEPGSGGYSVVFFAGGGKGDKDSKSRPSWSWTLQAYHLLGRAVRKRIKKLWVVHEKAWVRIMLEMASGVVSTKFRRKIVHVSDLTDLATLVDLTRLNIPPPVYLYDKKSCESITLPTFPARPQFNKMPWPTANAPETSPLPQVLVETSRFIRLHCLAVEGLFRIPPSSQMLEIVREAYDRRQFLVLSDYGPHVTAGLVKLYYRTLPEPVVPASLYTEMKAFHALPKDTDLVSHAKRILEAVLPSTSRRLLTQHLIPLLALVASHFSENLMTSTNLAICFAPSFVRSEDVIADANASRGGVTKLLEVLIDNADQFALKMPDRQTAGNKVAMHEKKKSESDISPMVKRSPAVATVKPRKPMVALQDLTLSRIVDESPIDGNQGQNHGLNLIPALIPTQANGSQSKSAVSIQVIPQTPITATSGIPSPPPSPSQELTQNNHSRSNTPPQGLSRPVQNSTPERASSPSRNPTSTTPTSSPHLTNASPNLSNASTFPSPASPPRVDPPRIHSLMRVATTPIPSVSHPTLRKTSYSNLNSAVNRETSPSGVRPIPKLRSASDSNWGRTIGKVKVTGRAVDELRALYEERAKGAEILVKSHTGSLKPGGAR